jgi:hypothetical protein
MIGKIIRPRGISRSDWKKVGCEEICRRMSLKDSRPPLSGACSRLEVTRAANEGEEVGEDRMSEKDVDEVMSIGYLYQQICADPFIG